MEASWLTHTISEFLDVDPKLVNLTLNLGLRTKKIPLKNPVKLVTFDIRYSSFFDDQTK